MDWTHLAIGSLLIIFILSVLGLFSPVFRENWFQHFGLIGIGLTSVSAVFRVTDLNWVSQEAAMFLFCVMLYAIGTALKVWTFRKDAKEAEEDERSTQS